MCRSNGAEVCRDQVRFARIIRARASVRRQRALFRFTGVLSSEERVPKVAWYGNIADVAHLLSQGADVNVTSEEFDVKMALMCAVEACHRRVAELRVERGACVNAKCAHEDWLASFTLWSRH